MNKKELKSQVKLMREKLAEAGTIPPYINLQSASEETMLTWLSEVEAQLQQALQFNDEMIELEQKATALVRDIDFTEFNSAKTLSQLGKAIANLSGKGDYADWQFTFWHKNGQARIYAKDVSYANPKERGYFLLKTSGEIIKYQISKNNPLPDFPSTSRDFYHDDVAETKVDNTLEAKVERYLKREFPDGNYTGQDRDDAYEMFENR